MLYFTETLLPILFGCLLTYFVGSYFRLILELLFKDFKTGLNEKH